MSRETGISAFPDGENMNRWVATLEGPKDTVYDGQSYKLSLEFGSNYPYAPPVVKFVSKCYHPNVDGAGNICLDILKEKWSALYTVKKPNNDSPLNGKAARAWGNETVYKKEMMIFQSGKSDNLIDSS